MLKTLIDFIKAKCTASSFIGNTISTVKDAFSRFWRILHKQVEIDGFGSEKNTADADAFSDSGLRLSKIKAFFFKLPRTTSATLSFLNLNALNLRTKELWRLYGIFTALLVVMLTAAGGAVKLSSARWERGLRSVVEKTLSENTDFNGKVGRFVRIKSPFSLSAALFDLEPPLSDGADYAIVIRVQTMYGPFPAVFVYGKESDTRFIGFASISGRVKRLLEDNDFDPRIRYWTAKVPAIMRTAVTRAVAAERE